MSALLRQQYFRLAKRELGGNLYSVETFEDSSQWVHCYFMSQRRQIVYLLCLSTATFELKRKLKKQAALEVCRNDPNFFDFAKQSTELLYEELEVAKSILAKQDVPIFQKCVKIHTGGNYHEIIKGVVNLSELNHLNVHSFITDFLNSGENFWYSSQSVVFTEEQINSLF